MGMIDPSEMLALYNDKRVKEKRRKLRTYKMPVGRLPGFENETKNAELDPNLIRAREVLYAVFYSVCRGEDLTNIFCKLLGVKPAFAKKLEKEYPFYNSFEPANLYGLLKQFYESYLINQTKTDYKEYLNKSENDLLCIERMLNFWFEGGAYNYRYPYRGEGSVDKPFFDLTKYPHMAIPYNFELGLLWVQGRGSIHSASVPIHMPLVFRDENGNMVGLDFKPVSYDPELLYYELAEEMAIRIVAGVHGEYIENRGYTGSLYLLELSEIQNLLMNPEDRGSVEIRHPFAAMSAEYTNLYTEVEWGGYKELALEGFARYIQYLDT